ncbi:hypothetical protein WJ0W_003960 [Paenibacillus melissococcoides]|uniref:Uncharacterized protein n=1 Tax=Paenibacillus melissococcoides TaxID=2912268 RepID=A0ABN8U6I9_9BACL|nr:hypothetical protein WJ0W_003960 [Paenibacillus melissococcoides]
MIKKQNCSQIHQDLVTSGILEENSRDLEATRKGAKTWSEWQGHSKLGPVPDEIREKMLNAEKKAKEAIVEALEKRLNKK